MTGKRYRRIVTAGIALLILVAIALYVKRVHVDCRFGTVDCGRFYKSGAMPLETLKKFVKKYDIRTVIDLRNPGTGDALCPEHWQEIESERNFLNHLGVVHAHIPSKQVPEPETLDAFFIVMDNPDSYPVLIHCHHGTGRAELLTALYRIEYLDWSVPKAVSATRLIITGSSFAPDKSKGRFLRNYQRRAKANVMERQTLNADLVYFAIHHSMFGLRHFLS